METVGGLYMISPSAQLNSRILSINMKIKNKKKGETNQTKQQEAGRFQEVSQTA